MPIRIEVARDSSFCPGVKRAFSIAEETIAGANGTVYSVGPLIHNPQAVSRLRSLGLEVIDPDEGPLPELEGLPVVIRSHGIDTETEVALKDRGALLVDATCPTVKHSQEAAQELARAGYRVVVLGARSHPEVRSIVGRAGAPVTVLESVDEAVQWIEGEGRNAGRIGVVAQTTASRDLLIAVVSLLKERVAEVELRDTICSSVAQRQEEALELAGRVDLMLVVGGHNSSNTNRLAAICESTGVPTRHIEDPSEIRSEWLAGAESVGIIGGSSTPDWLIEETVARINKTAG